MTPLALHPMSGDASSRQGGLLTCPPVLTWEPGRVRVTLPAQTALASSPASSPKLSRTPPETWRRSFPGKASSAAHHHVVTWCSHYRLLPNPTVHSLEGETPSYSPLRQLFTESLLHYQALYPPPPCVVHKIQQSVGCPAEDTPSIDGPLVVPKKKTSLDNGVSEVIII